MGYGVAAIGEALIDFIPDTKGVRLKEVAGFQRVCGGAPCNVCAAVAKLGGESRLLTQLGNDAFGSYILDVLQAAGVDVSRICRTDAANTALAFVSLSADGNRDFSFYRNPSADLLYAPEQIAEDSLSGMGALHFCSVDLVESPMRQAHRRALELAQKNKLLISFDPNIRLPLWEDENACRDTVLTFLPYADVLKISDDELAFLFGESRIERVAARLFSDYPKLKLLLFSEGANGARLFTEHRSVAVAGLPVSVRDTTGAGDALIGAFLFALARDEIRAEQLCALRPETLERNLAFANFCASYSVTKSGAIAAYGSFAEIASFAEAHGVPDPFPEL